MKFVIFFLLLGCQSFYAPKRVVLHSTKIYSPKSGFLPKKYIIINKDNGKIIDLTSEYTPQKNDEFYNFEDQILLPGYIDAHTHLFLEDASLDKDLGAELVKISNMDKTKRLELGEKRGKALLKSGFTSVKDLGNSGMFLDQALAKKSSKYHSKLPRIYFSGPGLCVEKCQFNASANAKDVAKEYFVINDLEDAKLAIKKVKNSGAQFLKLYADNIPSKGEMSEELFKSIVDLAIKEKLKVAVHAIDKKAIEMSSRYKIHSLEHAHELSKIALKNIKLNNIMITPTDLGFDEQISVIKTSGIKSKQKIRSEYIYRFSMYKKRIKHLQENELNFAFGSDFYFPVKSIKKDYMNSIWSSVKNLKRYGLTLKEIIYTLTVQGAKALGEGQVLGDIAKNYYADIIVLKSEELRSLDNLRDIKAVFKAGNKEY